MVFVPIVRRKLGYNLTVNGFQVLAIIALVVLATTQWYAHLSWAVYVANCLYTPTFNEFLLACCFRVEFIFGL